MKDLTDQVVVITGASSGIGRATAIEFARAGAKVVLAARDAEALKEAASECEGVGATAMAVVCDVIQEDQVERLASRAEEAYGRIDIWINNAGVAMFAKFEDAPAEDFRRVIDTNFFGYVYGARSALKRFKAQTSGSLINVDSVEGIAPKPYNSAYAASKHAVRAFSSSLRMELILDGLTDIHVSTLRAASVDTPLFAHAANYTGKAVQGPANSSSPIAVAMAIIKLAQHPQRELTIGPRVKAQSMQYSLAPSTYERRTPQIFAGRHFTDEEAATSHGNLYDPTGPHSVNGGWKRQQPNRLRAGLPIVMVAGVAVAVSGLLAWAMWPSRNTESDSILE
ncbi:MAG TPA: SDR family oxidoreductase [Candidatus Saccharimonadia bacterium]|nr:SDR family oxidoreductase [Candidatus Saccharimonadia bacterium]